MTVKEHYDNHLGNFYSWFTGDFDKNKNSFREMCINHDIKPYGLGYAIDLGAGHGIQSIALAELGFKVKSIDFNKQLIDDLKSRIINLPIEVIGDDLKNIGQYSKPQPELAVCCGDTLSHLGSFSEVVKLIEDSFELLISNGRLIFTFRDYSMELVDTDRFIHVKSDPQRILTCFIEYFEDRVRVTDLLHEFEDNRWIQKISSYYKTRISRNFVLKSLKDSGFTINFDNLENGMVTIIGQKIG